MKIAIFSGEIPSTAFIERLVIGVAQYHKILLFGTRKKKVNYKNENLKQVITYNRTVLNALVSIWRSFCLALKRPRDVIVLLKEVSHYPTLYDKWIWYSRLLPIVLHRPDIIHLQWTRDVEFYSCLKLKFHIPIIVSFRGAHINYTPIFDKRAANMYHKCFPHIDGFHAVSKAIVREASKYGEIKDRTSIIYSPIPQYFFDAFPKSNYKMAHPLNLVSIGRLHWKKGYSYALEALALLKKNNVNFKYSFIGLGEPNEPMAFQINQLGLKENINFKGELSQIELIKFLQHQDILLLPSVEEGIANVVLEAMAVGLPVVSSDCGGMSEVILPNETGWLVPVRDAKAIHDAIIEIINLPEKRVSKITHNAHNYVKEHFSANQNILKFIDLYETVYNKNDTNK